MRLNVSNVDSLEAVYLCISVKGYFRNELCEDVKRDFYTCNIYSDICFTFKHLSEVLYSSLAFLKPVLNKIFLSDYITAIKLFLLKSGTTWKEYSLVFTCKVVLVSSGFPHSSVGKSSACNAGDPDSIPGSGRSPGEGNSNPLQYSCLENPTDRGAWQATVHGIARVRHDLATKPPPRKDQSKVDRNQLDPVT